MGRLRPRRSRAARLPGSDAAKPQLAPRQMVSEPSSAHGVLDPCLLLLKGIWEISFLLKAQMDLQERSWGKLGRGREIDTLPAGGKSTHHFWELGELRELCVL